MLSHGQTEMCIPFLIIFFLACCSFEISHDQRNWRNEGFYGVQVFFPDLITSILRHKTGGVVRLARPREGGVHMLLLSIFSLSTVHLSHLFISSVSLISLLTFVFRSLLKMRGRQLRRSRAYMLSSSRLGRLCAYSAGNHSTRKDVDHGCLQYVYISAFFVIRGEGV